MQMRAIYAECLGKLMEADERIVLLDADLGKASGTLGLRERFPERIYDCGVAEQNMCSIAAGLASYGFTPWIESFTPFATRRICDQIAISVCYAGQNVKIVGTDPGITAELNGGTHMSMEDIGVLRSIPGIVIFEPVDEVQLRAAMPVLQAYPHPVYLRLVRGECGPAAGGQRSDDSGLRHSDRGLSERRRKAEDRRNLLRGHQRPHNQADRPRNGACLGAQDRRGSDRGKPQHRRRSPRGRPGSACLRADSGLRSRRGRPLRRGRQAALPPGCAGPDRGTHSACGQRSRSIQITIIHKENQHETCNRKR